jgi:hypothetical protein
VIAEKYKKRDSIILLSRPDWLDFIDYIVLGLVQVVTPLILA